MAFVLQFAVRTGVCGRLLYCIAGELDIVIVIPTPVNMYTQFRPKIRCKLWLLLCIHIHRSRYRETVKGWLFAKDSSKVPCNSMSQP